MKDELGRKIMKEFIGLRAKTYIYLKSTQMKIKKQNAQKIVSSKKRKFQDYKNGLGETQIGTKINYLRKKKIDVDSLKED